MSTPDTPATEPADDFIVSDDRPDPALAPPPSVPAGTSAPVVEDDDDVDEPAPAADTASEAGKTLAGKKKSLQSRIDELTREKHQSRAGEEAAKAEAAQLRRELEALRTPATKPEAATPEAKAPEYLTRPRPSANDIGTKYDDYEAYRDDLEEWRLDEREARREQETRARQVDQSRRELTRQVQTRIEAFKADHADYEEVTARAIFPTTTPADVMHTILTHLQHSELGPALAYELGQHPEDVAKLAEMPSGFALAYLGRLEQRIEFRQASGSDAPASRPASSSGPVRDVTTVSSAQPPPKPVGSSPVITDEDGDPDDLSPGAVDAYINRENARDRERRRRR